MYPSNLAVLRGTVRTEPIGRDLASGRAITQFDVATDAAGLSASVPVSVPDRSPDCRQGDEVVVVGHVERRFFRYEGRTQSRTEVVASAVVRTSRRRSVEKALAAAAALVLEG